MRHLSWGLTIFGAIGGLGLGAILAEADSFAGRADFGPANAFERRAAWGQGDAGHCRILNPTITIRKNGTASFSGQVASTHSNDAYCVILDFFDRNQQKLSTSQGFARQS